MGFLRLGSLRQCHALVCPAVRVRARDCRILVSSKWPLNSGTRRKVGEIRRSRFLSSCAAEDQDGETIDSEIAAKTTSQQSTTGSSSLLHPEELCGGIIPYPKALSPSAIMEFKKCPQSFLFQYLLGLKQPTSPALAKGSMCHSALEKVFDLEHEDRTLKVLQDLFRSEWSQNRLTPTYRILFEGKEDQEGASKDWDIDAEREWGKSGLQLLENYYNLEDPRSVKRPNPVKREIWLNSHLSVDPQQGVTAKAYNQEMNSVIDRKDIPTFHVRGIVDRLDMVRTSDNSSNVSLRIVDYKTGKAPNLKYSKWMNDKIIEEAFFQLKIYALLLREKGAGRELSLEANEVDIRLLRLFYLNSESGKAVYWDLDIGQCAEERDACLQETHKDLSKVWMDIVELVSQQDPKAWVGCDRSFCYCHKCRPNFVPGTVWEPPVMP